MKLSTGLILGLLFSALIFFGVVSRCNRPKEPMITVKVSYLDSLKFAATIIALPPDTIIIEKIIKGDPIPVDRPVPVPYYLDKDSLIKTYTDSLVNSDISAKVNLKVKGTLEKISWEYNPITKEVIKEIYKPVPYPQPYERPIPQTGVFGSLGVGKGAGLYIFSGGVSYLNKKGRIIGIEAGHFQENYIKFNYSIKF